MAARTVRIQNVHPRRFRRSFADNWLAAGGSTDDLMRIMGWKTYDMVREYTEAGGIPRAHNVHARLSRSNRIQAHGEYHRRGSMSEISVMGT